MISFDALSRHEQPLAVVGLGYVGLPLAVALSRHFATIGFDISPSRVAELAGGHDRTREVEPEDLAAASVEYTSDPEALARAGVIIVAVPTPITPEREPDLSPLEGACRTVGSHLTPGTVVCFESTVYPGLTEEICVPIMEEFSGLVCGKDFWVGYSPERINPGDKAHTLATIVKVVAGQTPQVAELLEQVYGAVVPAGIHKASSIRVAEAAKVIENTQRDLNIALMNELAKIFHRMGIDTLEVLEAAGSKWNFLPFRPGLVGGHCIGVDPYYLTHKAESLGYAPEVILAGRRINDSMGAFVAQTCLELVQSQGAGPDSVRVGVLGLTFKENVPDLRNTRVIDIVARLELDGCEVVVHDPLAEPAEAAHEYGISLDGLERFRELDAVILAVAHEDYRALDIPALKAMFRDPERAVVLDVKSCLPREELAGSGICYWRL